MAERRGPNIATKDEYLQFLKAAKLNDKQKLLLAAHARKNVMTAEELALAGGWTHYRSANVFFRQAGAGNRRSDRATATFQIGWKPDSDVYDRSRCS